MAYDVYAGNQSACGDDDESIRLTPTDENQQPISSDYTLQLSPFSEGESYYIYGAETPFTIENSNKEVVEVIEGNSTLTFKPLLQGESIISIRDLFSEDKSSLSFPFFPCHWPKRRSDWRRDYPKRRKRAERKNTEEYACQPRRRIFLLLHGARQYRR